MAHKILECTVKRAIAIPNLTPTGGEFESNFQKIFLTADNDVQRGMLNEVKEPMLKALTEVLGMVGDSVLFVERELQFGRDGLHRRTIGVPWETKKRNRNGLGFMGFVDLEAKRGDELLIFDWKTEMPSEARAKSVERQMGLYAFCELEVRPFVRRVKTYCVYLKNALVDPVGEYDREVGYEKLKKDVEKGFDEYVADLESFQPVRRRNDYCRYCPFVEKCESEQE